MNIQLGYELSTGRRVDVPLAHTAVTGQTQASGKTTTLEALIHRSGRRAVAFLTKRGEGAFQTSTPVAPYFSEATDWEYVKEMLESQARTKLKFETSWIIEVSKGTKTLAEVKHNVETALRGIPKKIDGTTTRKRGKDKEPKWIKRPATGLSQGVYTVLDAYLEKLLPQIEKLNCTNTLDLKPGLNVMDLTAYSLEMQGLVVRSVLQWVYERERNVIVIIPEAWELLPQDRGSPVRLAAETYIRKGAVLGNYLWLDSQDIAGVNKAILRQVGVWIIGVQREANEVMRTLKQFISQPARPKPDDLMTLGKGQFLVAYDTSQFRVYVQPRWMGDVHARSIATGEETIESAAGVYREYLAKFKTARAADARERSTEGGSDGKSVDRTRKPGRDNPHGSVDSRGNRSVDEVDNEDRQSLAGRSDGPERYTRAEFERDQCGQTGDDLAAKTKMNSERAQAPVRHGAGDPAADADGAGQTPAILKSANGSGRVMAGTAAPDSYYLEQARLYGSDTKCSWCMEGNQRIPSSVAPGKYIHHTGVGRVLCGQPPELSSTPAPAPPVGADELNAVYDMDEIYKYIRARILADPAVLAVLRAGKSIEVVDQIATIEMGGDSASGAVAGLVEEGFFNEPRTGNAVCKELIDRRRKSFARSTVYDACDEIAGYGFLVKDKSGYVAVPGVAIRRRQAGTEGRTA